jgi:hypothetical protein
MSGDRQRRVETVVPGEIASIEYVGYRHVYDLETENNNAFLANGIASHNCSLLDKSFLPIIRETMSGSEYGGCEAYAGTPTSLENTVEMLWQDSSQAEWCIPCSHCNKLNVPALNRDLEGMVGPWHASISLSHPAIVCAQCRKPVHPPQGRWIHDYPEKRWTFAGYHIPQIIMPTHYGDREKWSVLLGKQMGKGSTPINVFYNEVCAESYDTGSRLVTLTELRAASVLPWSCTIDQATKKIHNYKFRVLACDWGGGGANGISLTKMAVLGMLPNGKIHVIWGHQSMTPHDHIHEGRLVLAAINKFQCHQFVHDYSGAGSVRETVVNQAGWPLDRIIPISYIRAASGDIMKFHEATEQHPRNYWVVDKSRSLMYTCQYIKMGWLQFFRDDYEDADNPGLIRDFLALVDEKVDSRLGQDHFLITRDPNMSDDFAQAVNIGCCALWRMSGKWPNLAQLAQLKVSQAMLNRLSPPKSELWIDL